MRINIQKEAEIQRFGFFSSSIFFSDLGHILEENQDLRCFIFKCNFQSEAEFKYNLI